MQLQHSLIISKDYLHQLWIWNSECFRSLMTTMMSKKMRRDLSWYRLNNSWIILFLSSPPEIILSFYKLSSDYFWRFVTSLVGQFIVNRISNQSDFFLLIVYLLCFFILPDTWRDNSATFTLTRKSKETLRYSVHGMAEGR